MRFFSAVIFSSLFLYGQGASAQLIEDPSGFPSEEEWLVARKAAAYLAAFCHDPIAEALSHLEGGGDNLVFGGASGHSLDNAEAKIFSVSVNVMVRHDFGSSEKQIWRCQARLLREPEGVFSRLDWEVLSVFFESGG